MVSAMFEHLVRMQRSITLFLIALMLVIAFGPKIAVATNSPGFKNLPLHDFMQGKLEGRYPLVVPVPVEYEAVLLEQASFSYAHWMRSEDAQTANETGELPAENGFSYGTISLGVGYDQEEDIFVGIEDPQFSKQIKQHLDDVLVERRWACDHALLLLKGTMKTNGAHIYSLYFATNISTNTVYVVFRPANNNKKVGDAYWRELLDGLEALSGANGC